jgi:hypothetical protein
MILGAALVAGLTLPTLATAQPRHGDWHWRQRNMAMFDSRGQCQRALMAERNAARMDARRFGYDTVRFNRGFRLTCLATRAHGRVEYRIG